MQVRTRHTPAYGVARLVLAPAEPVQVESGAMLSTSYGVGVAGKGGAARGLGRVGKGAVVFTAPPQGGWVDVAGQLPGDVHVLELDGTTGWCVARSAWLASASTIALDQQAPPLRALFGGDHGFLNHLHGHGSSVLTCYGALDVVALDAGELVTVDSGHVLAFPDTVRARLRALRQGGEQSVRTGDGLVFDFAGPGLVLTQTRNPRGLVNWLQANGLATRA
ncbi:AIM24 family protein [Goodfellowiella coeruleoviolacea]|uniref:TIGR00266 family protein n=1 Tax=Goodfellowiella coeruleoviolacea TaxID=334858 RepID=A0AAE3GB32_9PSEU|nr:AIM24 family protein [Goodfellowiella coeruleoviolacea]MCP2164860.1 TIGR00266 family protein [Goodfellowiella coeruleoviolacea]